MSGAREADRVFGGPLPPFYETYLVPLIFAPYAGDLVARLAAHAPSTVLEIACGTGIVTRTMAGVLEDATIVATDLNQPMLDHASTLLSQSNVEWKRADAMSLPFPDGSFDAVICQFGVMFFPEKTKSFTEVRRVLRPDGVYLFNVWDRIEENEFAEIVTDELAKLFPSDPPRFMARTPHGYHDVAQIHADLDAGGFGDSPVIETVAKRSRADSPRVPAVAYCNGTPLRDEIAARDKTRIAEATDACARAIESRFGGGAVDAKIQAHIVAVTT